MCGIAVIFGKLYSPQEYRQMIQKMNDAIKHRGPDDEGVAIFQEEDVDPTILFGNTTPSNASLSTFRYCKASQTIPQCNTAIAAIGHRRLSIVDLTVAGHQPMCTENGRYWITYNGEVYNYPEIRKELETKGYVFQTKTDTEVILKAYDCWGVDCLHKFNGMFAFAIIDNINKNIFAARDRFGVKPLYMWRLPRGTVALASEIKQFTVLPDWQAKLNHQQAYDFLNWGVADHTEETFFQGVQQLLPGHYFLCNLHENPIPEKWYSIQSNTLPYSFDEASSYFHDIFFDAIKLRLRADVEVGSCLSGGLDSSSIVCAVDHLLEKGKSRQSTFSACSYDKAFDERKYVDEVLKERSLRPYYIYPSLNDVKEHMRDIVNVHDEPFGSSSIIAQWLIFKEAKKQGVAVMLDGQGADEQLAGYHSFYGHKLFETFTSGKWLDLILEARLLKRTHRHLNPYMLLGNRLLPGCLRNPFSKILGKTTTLPHWLDRKILKADPINPLDRYAINSVNEWGRVLTTTSNLPTLLRYEDTNSMAHSIEARPPFLDYRIVEFCLNLPTEYKMKGVRTKHLLRHSMNPYLPQKIVDRLDKMAFVTPEEKWMKDEPYFFRKLIEESVEKSDGLIKKDILKSYDRIVKGQQAFNYLPWRVISFGQWMKQKQILV